MTERSVSSRSQVFQQVFRFTFRLWRAHPGRICLIVALILATTLAEVFAPLYAGKIITAISNGSATEPSVAHAALAAFVTMLGLGAIAIALRFLSFRALIPLSIGMTAHVAADAFHRVQRFSTDWHANNFAGSTVRKITRGAWALDMINEVVLGALLPSLVMLAGATAMLSWHWPLVGLVVGVSAVLHVGISAFLATQYIAPAAALSIACDTRLGGAMADAVTCNAIVKAFGAEVREENRLALVLVKWRKRVSRTWLRGIKTYLVQSGMLLLMQGAILGTALWMWRQGAATPGDLTFVLVLYFVLHGHLADIGYHMRNLQRAVSDMQEMVGFYDQPPGVEDACNAAPAQITAGRIQFDHITFKYAGQTDPLYRDFSVTIPAGQRVGLVGHSGSGKTSFVKLVQRLYDVSEGAILIDGQNVAQLNQSSLRQRIAIVQQEPVLFHRSLWDNIAYAKPGASSQEVERAARLANAHAFIERLPRHYNTLVGERGVKLSGGERQRVALARAFLADAPILILDEATSSLDSESEHLIQEAMARLMHGRTTLVIAHRLSTVQSLDRLLVFDQGQIVEEGTHHQLLDRPDGIYRRLFERQALDLIQSSPPERQH